MVQFLYLTLHLGIETVSCRLLPWMTRMGVDTVPANITQKIVMLLFPDEICLISAL